MSGLRAAPKLATERARAILQHALDTRAAGRLFVELVMASELEALAQELLDARGAIAVLLNMSDAELDKVREELAALLERERERRCNWATAHDARGCTRLRGHDGRHATGERAAELDALELRERLKIQVVK